MSLWFPEFLEDLMQHATNTNLSAGDIRVSAINITGAGTLYTYSATHEFLSDVPSGARIGTSGSLTSKTFVDGVFDAADSSISDLGAGEDTVEALLFFNNDGGSDAARRLILLLDSGTGLPLTPSGGLVNLIWDNGSNKIAAL